jgi:hypothetical protein
VPVRCQTRQQLPFGQRRQDENSGAFSGPIKRLGVLRAPVFFVTATP